MPSIRLLLSLLALGLLVALLTGCGSTGPAPVDSRDGYPPAPEGYYRIHYGDTLDAIAFRQGVDSKRLVRWNELEPPYRIYAGKLLRVAPPEGGASPESKGAPQVAAKPQKGRKPAAAVPANPVAAKQPPSGEGGRKGLRWGWPMDGRVVQTFRRGDRTRQGIRIAGRAGEPVLAAAAGRVVYSGSGLKGYGNLIIVKHNDEYLSAYGFNRRLLVEEGDRVKRGQRVAEVGQASGGEYLLHFEIRRDGTAVDPLAYLPNAR
jgi:lipoprotein NlpD